MVAQNGAGMVVGIDHVGERPFLGRSPFDDHREADLGVVRRPPLQVLSRSGFEAEPKMGPRRRGLRKFRLTEAEASALLHQRSSDNGNQTHKGDPVQVIEARKKSSNREFWR